jgi:4-amino-4-deoxy-L-arabinose transferase-like glycosyltransferase
VTKRSRAFSSQLFAVPFLIVLAGFFRYYKLSTLPLGIYVDEAMNGNDGVHALATGDWRVFYPSSGGVEGLFINLQAISIWLFGATPWALRAVSALMGVLTVLGLYMLVRDLFGERHALLAGVLQSVLVWPVVVSRFGIRANMAVAVLVWLLWAALRAYNLTSEKRNVIWPIVAGALLGIGLNTYIAFRIVPLLVAAVAWLSYRERKPQVGNSSLLLLLPAIVIAAPLAIFFLQHPEWLTSHMNSVSVFQQDRPIRAIGHNLVRTLTMFFYQGDMNRRHNFGGQPMVGWIAAPFFAIGLWLASLRGWRSLVRKQQEDWKYLFIILWLAIGTIPGILGISWEFPHGLRLILIAPATSVLVMLGLAQVHMWLASRKAWVATVVTTVILMQIGRNVDIYFQQYANAPKMHDAFYYRQYAIAEQLLRFSSRKKRYVLYDKGKPEVWGLPTDAHTIAYLTSTLTPPEQDKKNIHYGYIGDVLPTDTTEVIAIPVSELN